MNKLLLTCLIFISTILNAQITLGSGTTTGRMPVDSFYGYTYSQQIFPKSEINADAAGNITGIKFYLGSAAVLTNTTAWKVYIGHTNKTSFSTTSDWIPVAQLTQVFDGNVTNNSGVVTIAFTTPFAYNNVDNLVIACDENTPNYDGSLDRFYNYTSSSNSVLYYISDTVDTDPAAPGLGTQSNTKSVITFDGLVPSAIPGCPTVTAPAANATGVSVTPAITWGSVSGATGYKISLGSTPGGTDVLNNFDVGNVTTYTLPTALAYNKTYYLKVNSYNATNNSAGCTEQSFTTVNIPCPTVSAPAANATNLSLTPTITWAAVTGATGYKITVGTTSGGTDVLNNFDVGNVTTYTFTTPLNGSTKYYYTVNSYDAVNTSSSCTIRNFTTLCGVLSTPYLQDFNSGLLPNCWSTSSTNNTGYALWRFAGTADYGTTNNGQTGGTYAWVDASSPYTGIHDVTLQSPQLNLTGLSSPMVQFRWFKNHATTATGTTPPAYDNNNLTIKVKDITGTTWETIFTNNTNFLGWRTEYITLPATYLNKTIEIQFIVDKDVAGNGYFYDNILLDDVQVKETPTCVEPSLLTVSAIGQTTATIGWTAPTSAPANGYQVYYSTSNTAPTSSTVLNATNSVSSTTTSALVSGLSPNTTYYFWVRSNCGPATTNVSTWTFGQSFNTLCSSTTLPYSMNFDSATTPGLPNCITSQNAGAGNNWVTAAAPTSPAGFTGNVMLYSYNTANAANAWFFTQGVNLTAGTTYYISYKYGNNSTFYKENLKVAVGTGADAASMTTVIADYVDIQDNTVHNILNMTFTPATTGVYYLGFNAYSIADQYYLYVDDVQITSTQVMATSEIAANAKEVKVYPNPFTDIVNISDINDVKNVTVVDMAGRVVKTINNPVRELQLGDLKSGMYILKIDYKNGTNKSVKAIKK